MSANIKELQISALSRINFCFEELQKNPPINWKNNVIDSNSVENTKRNFENLSLQQQIVFKNELEQYLKRESTTEARMMLVINYLFALLKKGPNNRISIHKNFPDKMQEITTFETENKDLLDRLADARKKMYAHIDPDWKQYTKNISFDEFKICIDFLNKLFEYKCFE